jgi:pimeloyl-ACP methyl ester carboxylesterase
MYHTMWCYEHVAFLTPEIIAAANTGVSDRRAQLYLDSSVQPAIDACPTWRTSVPPALEHEAVHSDIPTLILTGQFDPLTPPRYGEHIAATLSRGQSIELPNKSHLIVDGGGCGMQLASAFFDDPAAPVDTACLADIAPIEFVVP